MFAMKRNAEPKITRGMGIVLLNLIGQCGVSIWALPCQPLLILKSLFWEQILFP